MGKGECIERKGKVNRWSDGIVEFSRLIPYNAIIIILFHDTPYQSHWSMCISKVVFISMNNCTIDCIEVIGNFSQEATCHFVQQHCVQDTLQVIQAYYCLINGSLIILLLATLAILLLVYYAINIATDQFLAPCLEEFIIKLNMSQALAGITFLALANGAPDIVTAVVAGTSNSSSTALIPFGSLYGAALFSMGFILSMVIYYSKGGQLTLNIRETVAPLLFYIGGTLYLLLVSIFYKKMNMVIAVLFFSFYFMYFLFVIYEEHRKKKKHDCSLPSLLTQSQESEREEEKEKEDKLMKVKGSMSEGDGNGEGCEEDCGLEKNIEFEVDEVYQDIHESEEKKDEQLKKSGMGVVAHYIRSFWILVFSYTIPVILKGQVNTRKLILSLVLSCLVLFLASGIPKVFQTQLFGLPLALWQSIPAVLLLGYMGYNMLRGRKPYFTTMFNIYAFIVVVSWIALVVSVLINMIQLLQLLTNINSVFLGLTVLAWSGSIGDYLSITAFAKRGYSSTAVSAVFSGQLLNFLIGFGLASIINSLTNGEHPFQIFSLDGDTYQTLSDLIVLMVIGLSIVYMVGMIVVVVYKRGQLGSGSRTVAKVYYLVFVLVALAISISADFFREIICLL